MWVRSWEMTDFDLLIISAKTGRLLSAGVTISIMDSFNENNFFKAYVNLVFGSKSENGQTKKDLKNRNLRFWPVTESVISFCFGLVLWWFYLYTYVQITSFWNDEKSERERKIFCNFRPATRMQDWMLCWASSCVLSKENFPSFSGSVKLGAICCMIRNRVNQHSRWQLFIVTLFLFKAKQ